MTIKEAKQKLLAVAISNIGYHETGNNITKFAAERWDNEFYGWELTGQPWCDVFVDYCFCEAFGTKLGAAMTYQQVGSGSALCKTSAQYYKNNNAWSKKPSVGAQAFFYSNGDINHTGIVESIDGSTFTAIEGNTSDMVARRSYNINSDRVAGFGIPKWSLVNKTESTEPIETTVPTTPIQPTTTILKIGSKGKAVKTLQQNLITLGYTCGPDGADGDFGRNTYLAVIRFQRQHNLGIDGQVGPLTQTAIEKALKEKEAEKPPVNKVTSFKKGDKVKIKEGATYYGGKVKVPKFILNDIWIVYSINGSRVVINKNLSGTNAIMSPINIKNLIKV